MIRSWDLGGIRFSPSLREMVIDDQTHRLPPKPAAVLAMLAEAAPEPVSKNELLDSIWPNQIVGDSAVADAIKHLRRVVSPRPGEFIQTLHKHGYRLAVVPREMPRTVPSARRRRPWTAWTTPIAALAIGALVLANSDQPQAPKVQAARQAHSQADLYYVRGLQHYARYRPQDNRIAIELFERALELDPNYVRAWSGLGNAYAMQAHKFGGSREWIERSLEFSRQAIALDPLDASGYKALGVALSYDGRLEEAAQSYERALQLHRGYAAARVNLGAIRLHQGRAHEAITLLEGALKIAPGGVITRLQMGHVYRLLGMDDLAAAWYRKGMTLAPGSPADAVARMPFLITRGDFAGAHSMIDRMRPGFAGNPYLLYWSGMTALFENRLPDASRDFLAAADGADPDNALWLDARLRALLADRLQGRAVDDHILDPLEARVFARLGRGSESWAEPLRLALVAACRDDPAAIFDALEEAVRRGWLYNDELRTDPAFATLQPAAAAALAKRIIARKQELIAAIQFPTLPIASN